LFSADRQQNFRVNETHPAAPCVIVAQQKGVATMFVLFVHDGTRRGAAADAAPGMLMNAMMVETSGIRGGKIHEVEAAPFVTIPYGLGDGWTEGSGRLSYFPVICRTDCSFSRQISSASSVST
jgi:hypothetical protein